MSKFLFLAWSLLCFPMAIFSETIISFADANVKSICVNNWDTNSDDELSLSEAAAVTDLSGVFKSTSITSFDELRFFTGLTSIAANSFNGCSNLTTITIPESVTSINISAFADCVALKSVYLSEGLTSIRSTAFKGCTSLTTLVIPKSVSSIGSQAFAETGLSSVTILCNEIGSNWFANITTLTNVVLSENITTIGNSAFKGCTGLTDFQFTNVATIGSSAFEGCTGIKSLVFPASVTTIRNSAFKNSGLETITLHTPIVGAGWFRDITSLKNVIFGSEVTDIKDQAFEGCTGLSQIDIPQGINTIGIRAFYGCTNITSVVIPQSITKISSSAFEGGGLRKLTIHTKEIGDRWFDNLQTLTEINFGDEVTRIGKYAFSKCSGLTSLKLTSNITTIGDFAFSGSSLATLTIPATVKSIGSSAFTNTPITSGEINCQEIGNSCFKGVTTLENLILGDAVTSIGTGAFEGCSGLTEVTIPKNVTTIGGSPFKDCPITTLDIKCRDLPNECFKGMTTLNKLNVDNSAVSIGAGAFQDCTGLSNVSLGKNLTTIKERAFNGCSSLVSISIPINVNSVGKVAFTNSGITTVELHCKEMGRAWFEDITSIKNLIIGEEVTNIGTYAFKNCTGLTSISIPGNVKSIDEAAFEGCSELSSLSIADGLVSIKPVAFRYCSKLSSITLPDTAIDLSYSAFDGTAWYESQPEGMVYLGKNALRYKAEKGIPEGTSIEIKEGTLAIGRNCFTYVPAKNGLTSVTLPNSIIYIGERAFHECIALKSVYSYIEDPKPIPDEVFIYSVYEEDGRIIHRQLNNMRDSCFTVYVPKGTREKYLSTEGWMKARVFEEMGHDEMPVEIVPITETEEKSFSQQMDETTDLSNTVIDNTYYNMDAANGDGYDATEQALVLNSTTSSTQMSAVQGSQVGDAAVRENFSGIIFELPAGQGVITVDAKTIGTHVLNVQIGNGAPTQVKKTERGTVEVEYNITAPTYVYLYASTESGALVRVYRAPGAGANSVLLYKYKVTLNSFIHGDANGDMRVNVSDIVEIVNDILGKPSAKYNRNAADVNGDGQVNVTDIVNVVNIIMTSSSSASAHHAASNNR